MAECALLMQRTSVLDTLQQPSFNNSLKSSLASQGERRNLHLGYPVQCMLRAAYRQGSSCERLHNAHISLMGVLNHAC